MNRHGHRSAPISQLRLPGDIEQRRKLPHVIALGDSFAASGGQPGESPIVELGTMRLVAGRDRIAACLNQGIRHVDILLVSGTPEELERLALVVKVRRRPGATDREIARLLELEHPAPAQTFPEVEDDQEDAIEPYPPLAPRKPKSEAIRGVLLLESGLLESGPRSRT